jgi:hypothetical protein
MANRDVSEDIRGLAIDRGVSLGKFYSYLTVKHLSRVSIKQAYTVDMINELCSRDFLSSDTRFKVSSRLRHLILCSSTCIVNENIIKLAICFLSGILFSLFDPEDGGDVSPKLRLAFNGLHGITTQKIVHFNINTGLKYVG